MKVSLRRSKSKEWHWAWLRPLRESQSHDWYTGLLRPSLGLAILLPLAPPNSYLGASTPAVPEVSPFSNSGITVFQVKTLSWGIVWPGPWSHTQTQWTPPWIPPTLSTPPKIFEPLGTGLCFRPVASHWALPQLCVGCAPGVSLPEFWCSLPTSLFPSPLLS